MVEHAVECSACLGRTRVEFPMPAILSKVFLGFPWSWQINVGMVPRIRLGAILSKILAIVVKRKMTEIGLYLVILKYINK